MKRIHKNSISNSTTESFPSIDVPTEKPLAKQGKNHTANTQNIVYFIGKSFLLVFFVVLAIYGVVYAWSWSISTGKTQSEIFTELYFEDNLHLPSQVIPKHSYFFQFTLHNLEGKDMEYPYEVYTEVGRDKLIFDKGTLFVKANGYKTIQERFVTVDVLPKSEIVVDLLNKHQHIDFWIEGSR